MNSNTIAKERMSKLLAVRLNEQEKGTTYFNKDRIVRYIREYEDFTLNKGMWYDLDKKGGWPRPYNKTAFAAMAAFKVVAAAAKQHLERELSNSAIPVRCEVWKRGPSDPVLLVFLGKNKDPSFEQVFWPDDLMIQPDEVWMHLAYKLSRFAEALNKAYKDYNKEVARRH